MAAIAEHIPNENTLYHVMQCGNYRMHNDDIGGRLTTNIERALLQIDYKFIDCFPTHGGECVITLERTDDGLWFDKAGANG
jgi:hypothetical protein